MGDFSSRGVGAVLLSLVSRGHALIAELLRLSDHVPAAFDDTRYAPLLFDFKYFKSPDLHEERIETSTELLSLDDEFRESFLHILHRFYMFFHGVAKYYQDLLQYLEDLQEGGYIQSSVESVLENEEGCQLLVEALALHGVLLLLLEHRIKGDLREKVMVAYIRCKGTSELPNFDLICTLCRALPPQPQSAFTSMSSFAPFFQSSMVPTLATMLTTNKPEDLFTRLPLPKAVVSTVIGRLRADDIYHQIRHYPNPEHRWVALNSQAGCLYVLLYHFSDILQNDTNAMHEIVDKFFKDNWVIPIYMGFAVDLTLAWDRYKAAKSCIGSTLAVSTLKPLVNKHTSKVMNKITELSSFLSEGVLTHDYVLKNIQALVSCLRDCNVILRWLLLHRNTANRKLRDLVISTGEAQGVNEDTLFSLILDTSRLEFELKHVYGDLLDGKETRWEQCKQQAADCMHELADFFSGSQVLSVKMKDEGLQRWFAQMAAQVSLLDCKEDSKTGKKVQHMISALREVEQFHQVEGSLQTKQHLFQTRGHLQEMLQSLSVHESTLATISVVSDAAYAWGTIAAFTKQIHIRIQSEPSTVSKLQCLFLKLRSIMDIPLLRISQCGSEDIFSVSEYYSSELIAYVRTVLEIIPASIFTVLKDVVAKQSNEFYDLPVRLEKETLRDFAQLKDRYVLAKATHQVSILSQGIMAMTKRFIGTFELDPRQLIEDGIRKQLGNDLAHMLHSIFVFSTGWADEVEEKLQEAHVYLQSQQRVMEYFQDYVHLHGLHLWQEEFSKIVNLSVEQECSHYLKKKGQNRESTYRGPMPAALVHGSGAKHNKSTSFMGCIVHQLLLLSDPSRTMYLAPMSGWFSAGGQELVGLRTFTLLNESLGAAGMLGIDHMLSFEAASSLQECMVALQNQQLDPSWTQRLEVLEGVLTPPSALPKKGLSVYKELSMKSVEWELWVEKIAHIGRIQLLRCLISSHLHAAAKVESRLVSCALEGMNKAILSEIHKCNKNDTAAAEGQHHSEKLLNDLCKKLQTCGLQTPLQTIYITSSVPDFFSLIVFVITMSQLPRYVLDNHLGTLVSRMKRASLDFCPLVMGLVTLFRQFHPTYLAMYMQYLGQYVRAHIENMSLVNDPTKKAPDSHVEVNKMLTWIFVLLRFFNMPAGVAEASLPLATFTTIVG